MSFVTYKDIDTSYVDERDYLKTGITEFDKKCLGFGKGQLVILTGTRGSGKTSLLGQIKLNFVEQGYKGLEFNLEMTNKRAKQWLLLQACGKENLKTRTTKTGATIFEPKNELVIEKICNWLGDNLLLDDNKTYNAKKIMAELKEQLAKTPIDYVIIDNLFRMDIADYGSEKYLAQTAFVKMLQKFCQEENICLILVCHPTKVKTCPRIEDVSGSGDLINACDLCLIVHRVSTDFKFRAKETFGWGDEHPMLKYTTLFEVAKDREFGNEGTIVGLYFQYESKRFLGADRQETHYSWDKLPETINLVENANIDIKDVF